MHLGVPWSQFVLEGLKYQLAQLQKKGYLLRIEGRKTGCWKVLIKK
jgi:hypothetical protein